MIILELTAVVTGTDVGIVLHRESAGATAGRGQEHCDAPGGGIHHLPGEICRPSRRRLGRSWQVALHRAGTLLDKYVIRGG